MRTVRLRRPHHSNPFVVYLVTMCCLTFTLVFIFTQCAQFICNAMSQDRWLPVFSEGASSQRSGEDTTRNIILGLNTTVIKYSAFSTNKPLFLDQYDEKLFWSNPDNQIQSRLPSPEQLVGQIKVLKDHVIHSEQNCGWQTNQTFLHHVSPRVRIRKHVDYVCPLLVPQSNSFQHFIDGVLPKIMQVFHIINTTNVKILLYRSWDRNIEQILAELGFGPDRIVYYDSGYIIGKYVLDTCVTPPLHPSLWNMARIHLGVKAFHPVRNSNGFVVYISRTGSRNYGRNIKNEEEIINYLQRRYSNRFKFFQRPGSLKETMNLFKNTRILLGAHGGALYNILFCPQDTEIIEIMPTEENGNVVPNSLAHTIIWKMSSMLRQNYWRLPSQPQNKLGDIKPDLQKLEKVLNIIDNAHGL